MGYNNIQNGLQADVQAYSSPGAQRIIFIPQEDVASYQILSGDTVDQINLVTGKKYHLFDNLDELSYVLNTTSTKAGNIYSIDLAFTVAKHTIQKNTLFSQLMDTKVVAILQDNNFNWWLLGHEQPFTVPSIEAKIDTDANGYSLKLSTKQRETIFRMSTNWIQNLNQLPFTDQVDGAGYSNVQISIQVPTGNGGTVGSPTGSNQANIIIAPANNYVVANNISGVFAIGGRTVKLPPAPVDGQYVMVKDYRGIAATLPIVVDGNGHLILLDDMLEPTQRIKTNAGSLSLMFAGNTWHHYAFTY
jgi:hypothetical protein